MKSNSKPTNILKYWFDKKKADSFYQYMLNTLEYTNKEIDELIPNDPYNNKYVLEFKPSMKCNLQCSYCDFRLNSENDLTEYNFKKYIKYLKNNFFKKKFKDVHVFVHGGEPQLYKNLINNIITLTKEFEYYNFYFNIQTNGLVWSLDEYIENLTKLNNNKINYEIGISYHEEFTNFFDIYDRIKIFKKLNVKYTVAYMLTKDNITKNIKTVQKFKIMNINSNIRPILQDEDYINKNYSELIDNIDNNSNYETMNLGIKGNFKSFAFENIVKLKLTNFKGWECDSGKDGIVLSHSGHIYRCNIDSFTGDNIMYDANNDTIYEIDKKCTQIYCTAYRTCRRK